MNSESEGTGSNDREAPRPQSHPVAETGVAGLPARRPESAQARARRQRQRALTILAVISIMVAVYITSAVLLPVLAAIFFALFLNPLVRWLSLRWFPRWFAALLVVCAGLSGVIAVGQSLYGPAFEAAASAPRVVYQLQRKLSPVSQQLETAGGVGEALDMIDEMGAKPKARTVAVVENAPGMRETLGNIARWGITAFSIVLLVYFFLVYGEVLFRRIITIAPDLTEKRRRVSIIRAIQAEVSRYVVTITLINLAVALITTVVLYSLGVENYLLWGAMVGVFNYAPYVGPLGSFSVLLAVGILQFDTLAAGTMPALVYIVIHMLESQIVTPLVLGRNLRLNPLIILLWLMFWGWLWGIPGLLLGVPLLVSAKIICSHTPALSNWAQILEK